MASAASYKTKYQSFGTFRSQSDAEEKIEALRKKDKRLKLFIKRRSSGKDRPRYSVVKVSRPGSKRP